MGYASALRALDELAYAQSPSDVLQDTATAISRCASKALVALLSVTVVSIKKGGHHGPPKGKTKDPR
jgi:hypothetical protein